MKAEEEEQKSGKLEACWWHRQLLPCSHWDEGKQRALGPRRGTQPHWCWPTH